MAESSTDVGPPGILREAWRSPVAWSQPSIDAHVAMTSRRVERARAIAAIFEQGRAEHQPGLFDRRADAAWQHDAESRDVARAAATERVARAERALAVHEATPEIALVLEAGGRMS